jgi:hypothetical protein
VRKRSCRRNCGDRAEPSRNEATNGGDLLPEDNSQPSWIWSRLPMVRTLLGHLPKETRARGTWRHVEAALKQAATSGDTTELWAALQMILMLENIEYRLK